MVWCRPLFVFFALFVFSEAQFFARRQPAPCTTPTNEQGRCIAIEQCRAILSLTNRPNGASNQEREYIQQSQCGRNAQSRYPNVCCPNNGRPIVLSNNGAARPLLENPTRDINQGRPGIVNQGRPVSAALSAGTGTNLGNVVAPKNAALLAEDQCGRAEPDVGNRVLGGEDVTLGEFPWMALVQYSKGRQLSYRCGGVLINKRYVLTAAHCVHPASIAGYKPVAVRLGEHDKQAGTENRDCVDQVCSEPVVDVAIEQQIYHPSYNSNDKNNNNDVALFRLAKDITFTRYIKPICLPHQENLRTKDYKSHSATITGWGRTDEGTGQTIFASSNVLKKATMPIVDSARCTQVWSPDRTVRADMHICAGGVKGLDACKGDSGGPLMSAEKVARDRTIRFHVIGIVSYGDRCTLTDDGKSQLPGVYTRVSFFVDWILDQLKP